ncbi:uncharacterized protein LOC134754331 isoform X2 [Cydia strobilella]|uniref:uncharacterized protein LOC134754331 isoform X2 n=1 Tax=Cydia strobilella TaxID=1100964 RepID=UPI003006A538
MTISKVHHAKIIIINYRIPNYFRSHNHPRKLKGCPRLRCLAPPPAQPINAGVSPWPATFELAALSRLPVFELRKVPDSESLLEDFENMLNKNFAIAVAVVLACVCLAEAREESPHDMADALRMLQELDRYYTQAARPRFGKRSDSYTNWAKDLEKPDIPAWLQYARRR